MDFTTIVLAILAIAFLSYKAGREKALFTAGGPGQASRLHSRPRYYGYYLALSALLPTLLLVFAWAALEPRVVLLMAMSGVDETWRQLPQGEFDLLVSTIQNVASGGMIVAEVTDEMQLVADRLVALTVQSRRLLALTSTLLALVFAGLSWRQIRPDFRARNSVEQLLTWLLVAASSVALLTTLGIVLSVVFEAARFFQEVSVNEFLFGLEWSPQTAIREGQVGSSGAFGAVPLFAGTLLITLIAMLVAVPIGMMTAIYLAEYASSRIREVTKPLLEILAGIPTVVYGFFAAVTVAPLVRRSGESMGLVVASESALAAGVVMGIMIIPLISSMSDDALRAVPRETREGALALGSTRSEMMVQVLLPAALPGVVGGVLLAISRAIGETMIVVMAAGLAANLTANPFEAVTTVTVQIVNLLVGDQEFSSARTLAAFALGLVLLIVTLCLNIVGLGIVRRYRERYE